MVDWQKVATNLCNLANNNTIELNDGQRASLKAVATRMPNNGIIIADEVGMGKTRIATTVTKAVIDAGGRVAILVPPGLGFQWGDELRKSHVEGVPEILRSLDAYLYAWSSLTRGKDPKPKEHAPWANYKALIFSHAFCNWQVKSNTRDNSKWSLLPQTMALTQARLRESGRMPRGAGNQQREYKPEIVDAANWILENGNSETLKSLANQDGFNQWGNESPFFDLANYRKTGGDTKFREALEKVIGLGLGEFDLVVIDEAHKSRGAESNLERLLKHVILVGTSGRRLAMSATPIDLDAVNNWNTTLERIGAGNDAQAKDAIAKYDSAVNRVRQSPQDKKTRNEYVKAARCFESQLGKYLLRRDKREVESVKDFAERNDGGHSDYRSLIDIAVQTEKLSPAWKQAVCAAEALSFVTRGVDDQTAKRLRLTLGNGHGISALMDEPLRDEKEDPNDYYAQADVAETSKSDKRLQRVEWWKGLMSRALQGGQEQQAGEAALYEHPAILAAIEAIESVCGQGEKVLVFGRFTSPMQALVRLLNAREMLRNLDAGRPWPQAALHQNERDAVSAALRQLSKTESLESVNPRLDEQYKKLENERERFRTRLRNALSQSLAALDEKKKEHALTFLARPIREMLATDGPSDDDFVRAFKDVVAAASDQDKDTVANDDEAEGNAASQFSEEILQRMEEEYGRNEGGFARLMNGSTKPPTRRLLQLAFNREHSHPKVLVAQSVVGREGLNLHEACRTVILLHAEWNPGIVEQQIGRVDRINSLWEKKLDAASPDMPADALPRIEIRPVIFQGTYDEHNWKVLMRRWDDLRAQLHGVVITPTLAEKLSPELVESINDCVPMFSPAKSNPTCAHTPATSLLAGNDLHSEHGGVAPS
jgi:superfamily II DNA or RNA helicase